MPRGHQDETFSLSKAIVRGTYFPVQWTRPLCQCNGNTTIFTTQVKRARLQALEYKRQYGSPMPSRLLTLAMADAAQVR